MSYTKTVWQPGDAITVARLNKMEDGIKNAESSGGGGGGDGSPMALITMTGFPNTNYSFGIDFYICEYDSSSDMYIAQPFLWNGMESMYKDTRILSYYFTFRQGSTPNTFYIADLPRIPSGMVLCVRDMNEFSNLSVSYSGDVSQNMVTVFFGSTAGGRVITGDFSMTITKTS